MKKTIKYILLAAVVLFTISEAISLFKDKPTQKPEQKGSVNIKIQQRFAEITKEEKKIKETWYEDSRKMLYVSVKDDNTNRSGYADYICGLLIEANITGVGVRVIMHDATDSSKLSAGHRTIIGKSDCTYEPR